MAYTSPTTKNVGDAVTANDYNLVKGDLDDHETRIANIEVTNVRVEMFVDEYQKLSRVGINKQYDTKPVAFDFTATNASFRIGLVGTLAGTLEFDVKKIVGTNDPAGAVSIFTTKPSINFSTAVDYQESTNFVFDNTNKNFDAGDHFYLEITSMPTGGSLTPVVINFYGEV